VSTVEIVNGETQISIVPDADDATVVVMASADITTAIESGEQGPPGAPGPPGQGSTVPGPSGADGNTILYGSSDPSSGVGVAGNFYINTSTHFLFGPKTTSWPPGTSLIGPQGATGASGAPGNTILYGASDPAAGTGIDGNFYINTTTHFMFGPKAGGAWPAGTSLIGPQGPQGPAGATGAGSPSTIPPLMNGAAAVGTSTNFSREDHIHPSDTSRVAKTGDTMTGGLTIDLSKPLIFNKTVTSGAASAITSQTNGAARWTMVLGDPTAESGSDAGSNFILYNCHDAGGAISPALTINRASGACNFYSAGTFGGNVAVSGSMTAASYVIGGGMNASWSSDPTNTIFTMNGSCYFQYAKGTGTLTWVVNGTPQFYSALSSQFVVNYQAYKPGGGPWQDSSDARIKNIGFDYTTGLDAVVQLRPITYTFKGNDTPDRPAHIKGPGTPPEQDDLPLTVPYPNSPHYGAASSGKTFHGLIAQEVESVFPEMVTQRDGYIDGVAVTDLRDLDTSPLIFALVNAVKELKARVEALEGPARTRGKKP
jgi:hypothetical protein